MAVPTVAQLWIPGRLWGDNEVRAALTRKGGYRRYNEAKKACHHVVKLIAQANRTPTFQAAHVRFEWVEPNKRRDPSNVIGAGSKFVLDALKECGVLPNDGWAQILSLSHKWRVDKDKPGVLVTLYGEP